MITTHSSSLAVQQYQGSRTAKGFFRGAILTDISLQSAFRCETVDPLHCNMFGSNVIAVAWRLIAQSTQQRHVAGHMTWNCLLETSRPYDSHGRHPSRWLRLWRPATSLSNVCISFSNVACFPILFSFTPFLIPKIVQGCVSQLSAFASTP